MWRGVERRVNRRFSISARKLAVRAHIPWYLRWGMMLPFLLVAALFVWWSYNYGLKVAGFYRSQSKQELSELKVQVAKLKLGNKKLGDKVAQYESEIQIDQASNQATSLQLKNMTDENTRLQEDLVFFRNLTSVSGKAGDLGVHRLTLERDKMPGEYNLRMLLVQSGRRAKIFSGSYQLIATVVEKGQSTTHVFPQDESGNAQFKLSFRYYRRVEQSIQLPSDAQLQSVQVRIYKRGTTEPKVRQTVSLPLNQGVNNVQQKTQQATNPD